MRSKYTPVAISTAGDVTLAGTQTLTNKTIESLTNTLPAGHVVQCTDQTQSTTQTTVSTTAGTWTDTIVTSTISPRYNDSDVLVCANFAASINNTTTDAGFGFRFKRVIDGGTAAYPTSLTDTTQDVAHSRWYSVATFYHAGSTYHRWANYNNIDCPATTGSTVYTLQCAQYHCEGLIIGGAYASRWWIYLMEIKR